MNAAKKGRMHQHWLTTS